MKLLASMLNAQAMHYDGSNNIINSRGFIPGGRDGWGGGGGHLGGLIYPTLCPGILSQLPCDYPHPKLNCGAV